MTKNAFIAIVGCPNVGKSSILNKLLGQKIAIVSSKPQTTRTKIMGVLTDGETQLVFTDTPGYHKPHNKLGEKMNKAVGESLGGIDACLFVVEAKGDIKKGEQELLEKFKKLRVPVILAINKIDMLSDKKELLQRIIQFNPLYDFTAVVPVCASTGEHIDELLDEMKKLSVEGPHFFPDDTLTDQPERVLAAEIIREKILRLMDKEVP
ncbi:MAG: GTPase Era, partial [Eubacterium sp.]|nr:GTPase Era [Eubacterium sp.]